MRFINKLCMWCHRRPPPSVEGRIVTEFSCDICSEKVASSHGCQFSGVTTFAAVTKGEMANSATHQSSLNNNQRKNSTALPWNVKLPLFWQYGHAEPRKTHSMFQNRASIWKCPHWHCLLVFQISASPRPNHCISPKTIVHVNNLILM